MDLSPVHFVALATLVAAFLTAIVSLVSLVNSKEQKTTEFRQAWINSLRTEVAKFAAQARYIAGAIHSAKRFDPLCFSRDSKASEAYAVQRMEIAEAFYSISLHFKPDDPAFQELAISMNEVMSILRRPDKVVFDAVEPFLSQITTQVRTLLKQEWERVKTGEAPYKWTKRAAIGLAVLLFVVLTLLVVGIQQGWPSLSRFFVASPQTLKHQIPAK